MIWQKYFLKELFKVFALFICCFYFLYVFIDYASHAKSFSQDGVSILDIAIYYIFQFTKRAEVLIPVAFLVATVKVLTVANMRNEIVALASSGISLKKILIPFWVGATICGLFLFLNFQFFYPFSLDRLNSFEENYFREKDRFEKIYPVNQLILNDQTILVYQSYHPHEKAFFDVFWIKQANEFYRIKKLYPHLKEPVGLFADQIVRTKKGELKRAKSYERITFPSMSFDEKTLFTAVIPARQQALSDLFKTVSTKKFSLKNEDLNDREAQVVAYFFYKIIMPLTCFLAVLVIAPFCLKFGRNHPVFFIYALSIFGLITYFTLMNSAIILGESKVLPPFMALLAPPFLITMLFGWKFSKL